MADTHLRMPDHKGTYGISQVSETVCCYNADYSRDITKRFTQLNALISGHKAESEEGGDLVDNCFSDENQFLGIQNDIISPLENALKNKKLNVIEQLSSLHLTFVHTAIHRSTSACAIAFSSSRGP